jgi:hypothetical protein
MGRHAGLINDIVNAAFDHLYGFNAIAGQSQTQKAANNLFVSRPIFHNRLIVFFNEMRRKKKKNMQMDKKL